MLHRDLPLFPTAWSSLTLTARAMRRNHWQSGALQPLQKPRSVQTAQTDGARDGTFCSAVDSSWVCHFGNLTFTFGPDHGSGRWKRGDVPCPEPATLLVMALITGSEHEGFLPSSPCARAFIEGTLASGRPEQTKQAYGLNYGTR